MRQVNTAWTECPFNQEQLDKFFGIEKLSNIVKTKTYFFDASVATDCKKVFKDMGEEICMVQKAEKKAAEKAKKDAMAAAKK